VLLRSVGGTAEAAAAAEKVDASAIDIADKHKALLGFATKITEHAHRITDEDFAHLRGSGLSDAEILECAFVAALFNAINRMADTFGLFELMQLRETAQ